MSKEMRELLQEIEAKKAEMKSLLDQNKIEDAKKSQASIQELKAKYTMLETLEEDANAQATHQIKQPMPEHSAEVEQVFFKALRRQPLTEAEAALVTDGTNGENYLIPQDINTKINDLRRQFKAMRDLIGYYPTTTLTGSFVVEDASTITELTNFADGSAVPDSNDPKFKTIPYAVKPYGAILPVSNTVLQNEDAGLVKYIGTWFNKKAIRTENSKIFTVLKTGKTAKALADWKALKKSIAVDLDPLVAMETVIVTNQDGFAYLDEAEDANGRPILQPDPTNPTRKLFGGFPIEVFSNAELPTTGTTTKKAPIFYGNLVEGAKFVDRGRYEFKSSEDAGFTTNQTLIRVIEQFDVIQGDADAYVYGELTVVAGA